MYKNVKFRHAEGYIYLQRLLIKKKNRTKATLPSPRRRLYTLSHSRLYLSEMVGNSKEQSLTNK